MAVARSRFGQWLRDVSAGRDWLEGTLTAVGLLFLAMSVVFVIGVVLLSISFFDDDFSLGDFPLAARAGKSFGIALLGAGAIATFATGWWLAARPIRERIRARRRRHE